VPLDSQTNLQLLTNMRILLSGDLSRIDKTLQLLPEYETVEGLGSGLVVVALQLRSAVTTLDNLIGLLQLDAPPAAPGP
jgi:hypothetical protein